jgi:hypothetical protein
MTTKRKELTKIINIMLKYGEEQKVPYFNNKEKIREFRHKYTTDHVAGLIVKFMIPAYNTGLLEGYLKIEMERLRMMAVLSGKYSDVVEFKLTNEQEVFIYTHIVKMIVIIQS